jgi:alkylation response protein AidB-like acyl-CoA dehydrogenase
MDFAFTPEQESLRRSARQFLAEHASSAQVRKAMASPEGFDREVWKKIANDLGWTMLLIPEAYGGAGGSWLDLAAVLEETGRALLPAPLLSTVCLATNALVLGGTEELKQSWLPRVATGEALATVGWHDASTARPTDGGYLLNGRKSLVVEGGVADLLIAAALIDSSTVLFAVPRESAGLTCTPLQTLDQTRRVADFVMKDVFVPTSARLTCDIDLLLNFACVGLAMEQVGGAERCLDMAVDYAKTRQQFNRPIGSFQAIKHKCAEMAMRVESARSAAYFAAWAAAESLDELPTAASVAKAYCSEAFFHCAAENIQIHGGIGFTWEHDAHLYFKRAHAAESMLGEPNDHRNWLADGVLGS